MTLKQETPILHSLREDLTFPNSRVYLVSKEKGFGMRIELRWSNTIYLDFTSNEGRDLFYNHISEYTSKRKHKHYEITRSLRSSRLAVHDSPAKSAMETDIEKEINSLSRSLRECDREDSFNLITNIEKSSDSNDYKAKICSTYPPLLFIPK